MTKKERKEWEKEVADHVKKFDIEIKNKRGSIYCADCKEVDKLAYRIIIELQNIKTRLGKYNNKNRGYNVRKKLERLHDSITRSIDDIRRNQQ